MPPHHSPPASLATFIQNVQSQAVNANYLNQTINQPIKQSIDISNEKSVDTLRTQTIQAAQRRRSVAVPQRPQNNQSQSQSVAHSVNEYIDPFSRSVTAKPRPPLTLSIDQSTELERWQLLDPSFSQPSKHSPKHARDERKEPASRPKQPAVEAPKSSIRYDWRWLLHKCDQAVSFDASGQPVVAPFELGSKIVQALSGRASNDLLQGELMDLLGLDAFELICELLEHRDDLKQIKKHEMIDLAAAPQSSSAPPMHSSASRVHAPVLSGVTVTTQRAKEAEKARRRDERRMARHSAKDNSEEAHQRQRDIDQARLDEQAASLEAWRKASLESSKASGLPEGTKRTQHKGYEEVFIPPNIPGKIEQENLVPTSEFDAFARPAFAGITHLNRMQSKCFESVYKHNHNILVCAPTGAGKTNVAMMAVLREIGAHIKNGVLQKSLFKMIYVAPMKALAQEVQATFQRRLAPLGIVVKELTGDAQLTKKEIEDCQMIITTPEKWDVMTRKSGDGSIHSLVKLLIIDEVHLLNEDRGPVIEILVARTLRLVETRQEMCRIVGLSATLPNYMDVATFLGVNPKTGLFHFDSTYRPVPLTQRFIGIQESNGAKRIQLINEITYRKTVASVKAGHQVLVFVHSRRDTVKTAKMLAEFSRECGEASLFQCNEVTGYSLAERKIRQSRSHELVEMFADGFACHHAGMTRPDRAMVEKYFVEGLISVLVCTATLAWGVNLPSHTVVIKGTQIYDAQRGGFVDLGMLDIMQIFGRAGRPQYDQSGEGILISESHPRMIKYLSLINQAMPIESQFIAALPDHLNAEVVLGTVANLQEAIIWLSYTYLSIRMQRNPTHYGLEMADVLDMGAMEGSINQLLVDRRRTLVTDAVKTLVSARMMKCDMKTGAFQSTDVGRVASHYYLHHSSIETYNTQLKAKMDEAQIFHLISESKEFAQLKVRDEELQELASLAKRYAPVEVTGALDSTPGKVNVLFQAYISNCAIDTPTLISDSYFINQSAGRITRALFELTLKRGFSHLATQFLSLSKQIERRQWAFQSELRQFMPYIKLDTVTRIEGRDLTINKMMRMNPAELGEIIRTGSKAFYQTNTQKKSTKPTLNLRGDAPVVNQANPQTKLGYQILECISMLPYLDLAVDVRPLTRTVLSIKLKVTPGFVWNPRWHGNNQSFILWVEDGTSQTIYHSQTLSINQSNYQNTTTLDLIVPINDSSDHYTVRCMSEHWLVEQSSHVVELADLVLPELYPPHTKLLDLKPLSVNALGFPINQIIDPSNNQSINQSLFSQAVIEMFSQRFTHFNAIQTQVFHSLYRTDENVLVGAPTGSGKSAVAELAIIRMLSQSINPSIKLTNLKQIGKLLSPQRKAVYIAPLKALARERLLEWNQSNNLSGLGVKIVELTGDSSPSIAQLNEAHLIITTPEKWDGVSRQWNQSYRQFDNQSAAVSKQTNYVQQVSLIIVDEIHLLGSARGAVLEMIVSRLRFINQSTLRSIRLIGLSTALANAQDLGDWLGINQSSSQSNGLFNFPPTVRPVPVSIHVAGFPGKAYCPRMASMNRTIYQSINQYSPSKPSMVFCSSRRQTRLTAMDLISFAVVDGSPRRWLKFNSSNMQPLHQSDHKLPLSEQSFNNALESVKDPNLRHLLSFGIGLHHAGLVPNDRQIVEKLFLSQTINLLMCTATLAWGVNLPAHLVIVKGTEYFDASSNQYVDMPVTDVLQMIGRAGRPQFDQSAVAVVLVQENKKAFYMNFLHSPFPVESQLMDCLTDHLNAEVANRSIKSMADAVDWLSWTFLFRRLLINPSYYGLNGSSPDGINMFLVDMINKSINQLSQSGLVHIDHQSVHQFQPTSLGKIAAYYYLRHQSINVLLERLHHDSSLVDCLMALSLVSEFDEFPVRFGEDLINQSINQSIRHSCLTDESLSNFKSPHSKAFILFQCWFDQSINLPADYVTDSRQLIDQSMRINQSMIDFTAEHGWLQTCLMVCTIGQMISQSRWFDASTLLNVPYFDEKSNSQSNNLTVHQSTLSKNFRSTKQSITESKVLKAFNARGIHHLPELMATNRTTRLDIMKSVRLNDQQIDEINQYIDKLPILRMTCQQRRPKKTIDQKSDPSENMSKLNQIASITDALNDTGFIYDKSFNQSMGEIVLDDEEREIDEDPDFINLSIQLSRSNPIKSTNQTNKGPSARTEGWLILIGRPAIDELVTVRRVRSLSHNQTINIRFPSPEPGLHEYVVYLVSDTHLGLDQQQIVTVESTQISAIELPLPDVDLQSIHDAIAQSHSNAGHVTRRAWADSVATAVHALNEDGTIQKSGQKKSNAENWANSIQFGDESEEEEGYCG